MDRNRFKRQTSFQPTVRSRPVAAPVVRDVADPYASTTPVRPAAPVMPVVEPPVVAPVAAPVATPSVPRAATPIATPVTRSFEPPAAAVTPSRSPFQQSTVILRAQQATMALTRLVLRLQRRLQHWLKTQLGPQVHAWFVQWLVPRALRVYGRLGKRTSIASGASTGLAVCALIGFVAFSGSSTSPTAGVNGLNGASGAKISTASSDPAAGSILVPSSGVPFTPLTPKGKPQLARSGTGTYNADQQNYVFDDTYLNTPVRVAQQQMPANYKLDDPFVKGIAGPLKAASIEPISVNVGPAYLLSDTEKAGKQVVVFATDGMLLFVQSDYPHDGATWAAYLNSFKK